MIGDRVVAVYGIRDGIYLIAGFGSIGENREHHHFSNESIPDFLEGEFSDEEKAEIFMQPIIYLDYGEEISSHLVHLVPENEWTKDYIQIPPSAYYSGILNN